MKNKAIGILVKEFQKNKYFKAIYLWGSITTDEFDPVTSDIDAIGIVDDGTSIIEKEKVNKSIQAQMPQLKINFLYESELNGGPIRETMARVVSVESILYDMPFWIHVAGNKLDKKAFVLGNKTIDEVIATQISSMKKRFLPRPQDKDYIYFVKATARLCYFIHQKTQSFKPFRYHDLVVDSTDETREVCKAIVEMKDSKWNGELVLRKVPLLIDFLVTYHLYAI